MKVFVVLALFAVCANAYSVPKEILEQIVPRFTTGYIIKGEDAAPHSAPYIASLGRSVNKTAHICGGTIIDKEWVLTAAHCVSEPVGMSAIGGLHERKNVTTAETQIRVVDFGRIHEAYTGGVGPYDIALLHVSQPFVFNEWVQPAVLPYREEIHSGNTTLYGWGQPTAIKITGSLVLKTVETQLIEYELCKRILPENAPLAKSNICSDSLEKGISACNGDSGGPLVKEYASSPTEVIGVVSWGYIPCGRGNMPSIYTRVSAYVDWIKKIQTAYYTLF